jgi:hypothetical protein
MDRIWLVTRGEDSDQEVICACRSEANAQTMTDRLRTIGVRQIARFNDPVTVPLDNVESARRTRLSAGASPGFTQPS